MDPTGPCAGIGMASNPFLEAILARAGRRGGDPFAWVHTGQDYVALDWATLVAKARAYAHHLRTAGIGDRSIVFLVLKHGPEIYPAFLGAMLAGAVPSFLPFPSAKQDPNAYWTSHHKVFARTRAAGVVTWSELVAPVREAIAGLDCQVLDIENLARLWADGPPPEATESLPPETAVALLQHSSGTTGLKKGVALSYRAIRLQIESYAGALGLEAAEPCRIASWLPLYHDMGLVACFLLPLYLGIPIVSLDAFAWSNHPALLLEAIQHYRATHAWLPNFAFQHLVRTTPRTRRYDLSSVRALVSCSEPVKAETFEAFHGRFGASGLAGGALQACYAMAETVFAVTQTVPGRPFRVAHVDAALLGSTGRVRHVAEGAEGSVRLVSNGPPIDGMEVGILKDGGFVGESEVGEICARAPYLFSGYAHDPEATDGAFRDGWFRTGDLGFVEAGEVFVSGRIKDLLIINGRNYFAHDLEAVVNGVAGVKAGRCVALGVYSDRIGSEQIVIVAERAEDSAAEDDTRVAQRINHALSEQVGLAAGDVRIVDPGWLVKTTSGKISRSDNLLRYLRQRDRPDVAAGGAP